MKDIRPHPGPQEAFLSSAADIAIMGGAAGAGKSYGLLMEPTRHIIHPGFTTSCFRRQSTQVTSPGGLWDTSFELYPNMGAKPVQTPKPKWKFPSGASVTFSHLQYDKSVREHDGSQICLLMFDELQHFTENQWWYMLSRNRSTVHGINAYVRATCNPDPDSWLRQFLGWWIGEDGYPLYERSGVLRYMVRYKGEVYWGSSKQELYDMFPTEVVDKGEILPLSVTFIPGTVEDNPTLLANNPQYKANLSAMFEWERKRLLAGNWDARPNNGDMFKRDYWQFIDVAPRKYKKVVRYWDLASTVPSDINPDPDWTAGALLALDNEDRVVLLDMVRFREDPADVLQRVKECAQFDQSVWSNNIVEVWFERDPGQAGKSEMSFYRKELQEFSFHVNPKRTGKLSYWRPFAVQAKNENVYMLHAPWNMSFISEGEGVTDGTQPGHDDQIDAASGAFMVVASYMKGENAQVMSRIGGLG